MTFNNAAWAIDGARLTSALARTEAYNSASGAEGIAEPGDMKVTQLPTPGVGVQIAGGAATILNRYQTTNRNQAYTVINAGVHTITAGEMPPVSAAAQTFVVGIVVGDPEFSQTGHPFMPSSIPEGEEEEFAYVRPMVLTTAQVGGDLNNPSIPFLPLALIMRPANTTTITNAMITDIRQLARPRAKLDMNIVNVTAGSGIVQSGQWSSTVLLYTQVPSWATRVYVTGFVEGLRLTKAGSGNIFFNFYDGTASANTSATQVTEGAPSGAANRRTYNVSGTFGVTAMRGKYVTVRLHSSTPTSGDAGFLTTDGATQGMVQVYWAEEPS